MKKKLSINKLLFFIVFAIFIWSFCPSVSNVGNPKVTFYPRIVFAVSTNTTPSWWSNLWNNFWTNVSNYFNNKQQNAGSTQSNPGAIVSQAKPTNEEGFFSSLTYGLVKAKNDIQQFFFPFRQEVYNPPGSGKPQIPPSKPQASQQQGDENGTPAKPYKLEANQFKKMCGQNTYVLYWRKGGKNGRDMAQPIGGAGSGQDQGARNTWELPSCGELAECHCCCNTCRIPETKCQQEGWIFNNKGCPPGCSSSCEGNCKPNCEKWTKPEGQGDPTLNRDCKCNMEGCPKEKSKGCYILIMDPGKTDIEYTKLDGNKEQYFKSAGAAYFKNGNGEKSPSTEVKSKIKSDANDVKDNGFIKKLKDEKGKCCKCYQDGPPIQ